MPKAYSSIHVRKQRGVFTVQGMAQTPRGQNFIAKSEPLKASKTSDPEFKKEVSQAIEKLYAEDD